MFANWLRAAVFALFVPPALGQSAALTRIDTTPTHGEDIATFRRNVTHLTYDLAGRTFGFDWLRTEIEVTVVGLGAIWHARDEQRAQFDCADPNDGVIHNLVPPGLFDRSPNDTNTLIFDTFMTGPGRPFIVHPSFDSPGACTPCFSCIDDPPIVSTPTRIRGRNAMNEEIPLLWFDTIDAPLNNTVLARLTFQVPEGFGDLVVNPTDTTGRQLFATIRGRIWSTENAAGAPYAFDIWQTPEPASAMLAMLALASVGGSRRVRRWRCRREEERIRRLLR